MPKITSYWLMKAVDCIENPNIEIRTQTQELFYHLIEEDLIKKIKLMQKLLDIKSQVLKTEFKTSWEKEVEFLEIDIQAIRKWLKENEKFCEKKERHYLASELLRMFK